MKNMLKSTIVQFAINFLIVAIFWMVGDSLEINGKITSHQNLIASAIIWGASIVYWTLRYILQERK